MTERFLFPVYSWRYGSELRRYVGKYKTDEYLKTDLRLAIEDAPFTFAPVSCPVSKSTPYSQIASWSLPAVLFLLLHAKDGKMLMYYPPSPPQSAPPAV